MIFLVGYRGTGKSTVARLLAERLGWAWVDADAELEARHGPIPQIFAREGEAVFRDYESAILEELCRGSQQVIATGGGVVLPEANRQRMKQAGTVIWLTADADMIWQRLQADEAAGRPRPALTIGGREEIVQLLQAREPLYQACADWTVETGHRAPAEIVEEILRRLTV